MAAATGQGEAGEYSAAERVWLLQLAHTAIESGLQEQSRGNAAAGRARPRSPL